MRTPLAWLNLVHRKVRTGVAVAGVAFSVVLIFMQLGFLGSVETTATAIYDALDFDVVIRSREYLHASDPQSFPMTRLYQAGSVLGVYSAAPFYIELNQWRNPINGRSRGILVMGARSDRPAFREPELREKSALLATTNAVLMDRRSRREFGPKNRRRFSDADIGVEAELGQQRVRIVGHFDLETGLAADGAVVLNARGFCRVFPGRREESINLGLVRVADQANVGAVAARLRNVLPADVEVLTRDEVIAFELHRWIRETSIGLIFQVGVILAFVVGMAIVYQVLTTDVNSHLAEYATLKAIGYRNGYLSSVVLQQATALAILGFVPGLLLSEVLYRVTSYLANLSIEMTFGRAAFVLILSLGMCVVSGLGAIRKVRKADPADLY